MKSIPRLKHHLSISSHSCLHNQLTFTRWLEKNIPEVERKPSKSRTCRKRSNLSSVTAKDLRTNMLPITINILSYLIYPFFIPEFIQFYFFEFFIFMKLSVAEYANLQITVPLVNTICLNLTSADVLVGENYSGNCQSNLYDWGFQYAKHIYIVTLSFITQSN